MTCNVGFLVSGDMMHGEWIELTALEVKDAIFADCETLFNDESKWALG